MDRIGEILVPERMGQRSTQALIHAEHKPTLIDPTH